MKQILLIPITLPWHESGRASWLGELSSVGRLARGIEPGPMVPTILCLSVMKIVKKNQIKLKLIRNLFIFLNYLIFILMC